jgi:general secretion pathway protein J
MTRAALLRRRRHGFTLLELLVAISVLSIVSIIAWRGLESLVATRERLEPERDEVRALLSAFGQLERDLTHTAQPGLFALTASPIAVRPSSAGPVLEIVRVAPADQGSASALQIIYWRVAEGVLLRQATPPQRDFAPVSVEQLSNARLLPQVKSMRVRLWSDGGWIDPPPDGNAPSAVAPAPGPNAPPAVPGDAFRVPAGIEFIVERSNGTLFRRVLLVG